MIYLRPTRIPLVGGFWFYFLAENMMMAAREKDRKQLTLVGWLVVASLSLQNKTPQANFHYE
jgi:hypothetical protein